MKLTRFFGALSLFLLILSGCSDSDIVQNNPVQPTPIPDYTFVHFDPVSGDPAQVPLPNEILRNPVTGMLALPMTGSPAIDALISQVNTLSGFGTTSPIRIPFAGKVVPESVNNQTLLTVNLATQTPVAMNYAVADDESGENSVVTGFPVIPLDPGTPHIVIVTQGVIGTPSNLPVESESLSLLLKGSIPLTGDAAALEPVRQLYDAAIWPAAEAITGVGRTLIPFAFLFSTQPLFETMTEVRRRVQEETPTADVISSLEGAAAVDSFFNLIGLGFVPHDAIGAIHTGTFNAPAYISDPVNGPFQGSGTGLVEVGRNDVPFVVSLPPGSGPFPTLIFQHGITGSKDNVLGIANTANSLGVAVIAMDLVLHGERSADVINNDTGAPGPDGQRDPSGTNFINLANLLMSRDNARQSMADLMMMTRMIMSGGADFNDDNIPDLAPVSPVFVGMSLGGIVGTGFVTMESDISLAVLNVAGGRVAYLLNQSDSFGPTIDAGLAQFGLSPGTALYDLYFLFTQAIVDDSDPMNYGRHTTSGSLAGGNGTIVLLQEMIGDGVVPNSATRDLARSLGIPQVDAIDLIAELEQVSAPHSGSGYFQYGFGSHGTLLDPSNGNPTVEVQTQAISFLGSGLVGTPTIINPFSASKQAPIFVGIRGIEQNLRPELVIRMPQP